VNKGALGLTLDDIIPAGVVWEFDGDVTAIPAGWLLADGAAVSRAQYPKLFKAIGVLHGAGNGSTTFNLPNRQGKVGVGADGTTEFLTVGQTGGSKTSTAPHTHGMQSHTHAGTSGGPSNNTTTGHSVDHNHGNTGTVSAWHQHSMAGHAHGGITPAHSHGVQSIVYVNGTPAHGHDGAGGQLSERPNVTTGFGSNGSTTSDVTGMYGDSQQTNDPTANHVHGTGGVNTGHTHDMQSHTHGTTTGGPSSNTSEASSVGATSGNLQPYIVVNFMIKT
jgi:microcystin-dependent protein